jgi:hypothetical protein
MSLSLPALRGLATSVAVEEGGTLQLLGTMAAEGSADFVEVIFGHRTTSDGHRTLVITVKRQATVTEVCHLLREGLRAHLHTTA